MTTTLTSKQGRNLININNDLQEKINFVKSNILKMNISDAIILKVLNNDIKKMQISIKANNFILSNYPMILDI